MKQTDIHEEIYEVYKQHIKKNRADMEEWEKVLKNLHDVEMRKRKKKIAYYKKYHHHTNVDPTLINDSEFEYRLF